MDYEWLKDLTIEQKKQIFDLFTGADAYPIMANLKDEITLTVEFPFCAVTLTSMDDFNEVIAKLDRVLAHMLQ